ncbi:MAG: hypothetical protein NTW85_00400 [Methylococcales bacterium]|nr:hypothetical protein [Methylococcales bacterium]
MLESFAFGKSNFGKVSKNFIKDVGSSSINRMMDIDFPRAESVLKQNIARLNNHYLVRQKRTGLLAQAHNRIKELGVGEDTRREYQFLRYGKKSMADFEADDLADYCQYLSQPYPAFDINETFIEPEQAARKQSPKLNTQQKREVILGEWLKAKEYNDKTFDRWAMDYSTDDFYRILKTLGKTFVLADDTLKKFMDSQKICGLKVGRKTTV